MKAIGAKNSDISLLFLIESGILGLIGGLIGLALGASISKLVEFGASQAGFGILKVSFSPLLIFGSLLFSFIAGALSGTMPAIQASNLKPVEALRYEWKDSKNPLARTSKLDYLKVKNANEWTLRYE